MPEPILIKKTKKASEYKPMLIPELPINKNKDIVHYLEVYENNPTFDVWV